MKKTMLLLFGLFTFVACNEDVTSETIDEQQEESMTPFTIDPAIPYESPYDINSFTGGTGYGITYSIENNTGLVVSVTPYFGLAYFDGADDGTYDPLNSGSGTSLINPIDYPALYFNNNTEYLNLLEGVEYELPGWTQLIQPSTLHLPTLLPNNVQFDVIGAGGTQAEADILQEFGKVYYYVVKIYTPSGSSLIHSTEVRLEFNAASPSSPWSPLGTSTPIFGDELFVHSTTREIVPVFTNTPSEDTFPYMGNTYKIRLNSDANSVTLSVN